MGKFSSVVPIAGGGRKDGSCEIGVGDHWSDALLARRLRRTPNGRMIEWHMECDHDTNRVVPVEATMTDSRGRAELVVAVDAVHMFRQSLEA